MEKVRSDDVAEEEMNCIPLHRQNPERFPGVESTRIPETMLTRPQNNPGEKGT
jgi:hypothetical protein